jgi:hypothetical protein
MKYIVTCNGIRYTMPMSLAEAEKYASMRRGDRKNQRLTGERRDHSDNLTYGSRQRWEVVPA